MDLNNLERGGLQNLQNQETDFDQNAMWENLEPRKKRRPFFWVWFGGSVGVVLLSAGLFFSFFENPIQNESIAQGIDNQEVVVGEITKKNVEFVEVADENAIAATTEKPLSENQKPTSNATNEILKTETTTAEKTEYVTQTGTLGKHRLNYQNVQKESIIVKDAGFAIESQEQMEVENLSFLPLKFATLEQEIEPDFQLLKIEKSKIIPIQKNSFSISAFAGIGYQFRTLELKDNDFGQELLNTRNASESLLESLAFGFDVDKKINKKWSFGTGVELIQHTEKMKVENRTIYNASALPASEIPAEHQGKEGFLIKIQDSIYYNQHRLLNVPLRVNYFLNYKKWRFAPEASLVFNISQKSSGHLRNEFERTESISNYFKPRIGLGYRLGCKFFIPTKGKFSLYAKPSFEWNPSDVSSDLNSISQKRNLGRLDLGVVRKF